MMWFKLDIHVTESGILQSQEQLSALQWSQSGSCTIPVMQW